MEEKQPWSRHDWSCSWEPASAPNGHIGLLQLEHKMTIFGIQVPFSYNKLEAQQLGPGLVYMIFDFGIFGKGTTIHHMTPEEPLFQRARFVMYATPRTPMLFAKIFHMSESGHFERDISIWSNKRYAKKPILCKEDASILKHRRWYNQFYTDNSPRLQPDGSVTNMENIRPAPIDW
uniref:3-ketosteroid-9-alpha-monooxygenase oxygenase component-like C-terminal domain-containing protein n=1 Tax=Plectus sambesii TaxID=2011161 RepID=A0A914UMM2_9BILA